MIRVALTLVPGGATAELVATTIGEAREKARGVIAGIFARNTIRCVRLDLTERCELCEGRGRVKTAKSRKARPCPWCLVGDVETVEVRYVFADDVDVQALGVVGEMQ